MTSRACAAVLAALTGVSLSGARPAAALEPRPVTFAASDGLRLGADYYAPPAAEPGDAPVVILLHGLDADRKCWEPLLVPLHEAGFAILALDLRGHGASATTRTREAVEKRDPTLFRDMHEDLLGAYDWLATQPRIDRARVALVGAGVGASVALHYAAYDRSVDAVACLAPGLAELGLDPVGDVRQLVGRRVLVLADEGGRDAAYTLQQSAPQLKIRLCRDQPAQGTDLLAAIPEAGKEIAAFLKAGVGEISARVVYGSVERNIYHEPDSEWITRITRSHLRYYSSPEEAQSRGLRSARSKGPDDRSGSTDRPSGERPRDSSGGRRRAP